MLYSPLQVRQWDGESDISEPGIYAGLPIELYHQGPVAPGHAAISKSGLTKILYQSPAHYDQWRRDQVQMVAPAPALSFGKAAHMLLLGEEGFAQKYVLMPFDSYRTKEAKAWKADQIAAGLEIITQDQVDKIKAMRDALAAHPLIQQGALDGRVECSMFALIGNAFLQSRPDVIPADSGIFADLKTTNSVDYDDLERDIWNFGYHLQAAVVQMCCEALDIPFEEFTLIFVEKDAPHVVRPVALKKDALQVGRHQVQLGLKVLKECIRRDEWPGPQGFNKDVEFIGIPGWAEKRFENRKAFLEGMVA